ncbi:hypothetical protein RB628_03585 [Streptomyces sp. ADMS]|uniref:hypothetical protein n=1 Tax=Streptomyces sp. ADMS TaxID=3071415 RepID=UPI00296F3CEF|nr:hypothetical protein [Streptomyces sp. ADMS]MDW4904442.1 hypothetical protein [Streptomyces sp. ADMS]
MNALTRDRWWYLTEPDEQLLATLGVKVFTAPPPTDWPTDREFMAGISCNPSGGISHIEAAPDLAGLEREYIVRGLLAKWHGADTADWPVTVTWTGRRA